MTGQCSLFLFLASLSSLFIFSVLFGLSLSVCPVRPLLPCFSSASCLFFFSGFYKAREHCNHFGGEPRSSMRASEKKIEEPLHRVPRSTVTGLLLKLSWATKKVEHLIQKRRRSYLGVAIFNLASEFLTFNNWVPDLIN
ncbi:hypothetical protein NC653_010681 [Populus alba x Populus x berolinensis]|uniref:Uncharacterized protein n=1 Tax=Populus alba x Populus x berolinensis TaxID=444605 RepID=A0AAD6R0G1_9ROSI|nr:hypothetical protein NC653_010681 [Populus alba x Populus x berolinensis]